MPNHITNIIQADREVLDALCVIKDGKKVVDFETILPMPESILRGSIGVEMLDDPGAWYRWSIDHWGTKWNAYDQKNVPDELRFDTAWSHPEPVIRELSRRFPDREIKVAYADEDTGHNLGVYVIKGGMVGFAKVEEGSPEAENLANLIVHGETTKAIHDEWESDGDSVDREGELDDKYDPFDLLKEDS